MNTAENMEGEGRTLVRKYLTDCECEKEIGNVCEYKSI